MNEKVQNQPFHWLLDGGFFARESSVTKLSIGP